MLAFAVRRRRVSRGRTGRLAVSLGMVASLALAMTAAPVAAKPGNGHGGPWASPTPTPTPTPTSSPTATSSPSASPSPTPSATPSPSPSPTPAPSQGTSYGVPSDPVNYAQDVETWWANHPFNPDNPNAVAVGGVLPPAGSVTISLSSGQSIQSAIDACPQSSGCAIHLGTGTYANTFSIVGKSNIYLMADSLGAVTLTGGYNGTYANTAPAQIASNQLSVDYSSFINCITYTTDPNHAACLYWANNPLRGLYFKNLVFDGSGSAYYALIIHNFQDILFDNVMFQNFLDGGTNVGVDLSIVTANALSDRVWFRNCKFLGHQRMQLTLDGNHGSGVVNSQFTAAGGGIELLFLSNTDYDWDYNGDGVFELNEERDTQYAVVYGSTFDNNYINIRPDGAMNSLFKNNTVRTAQGSTVTADANFLDLGRPHPFRPGSSYSFYGNRAVSNTIVSNLYYFFTIDSCSSTCSPDGQFQLKNNTVQSAPSLKQFVVLPSDVALPYCIQNNMVNGSLYPNWGSC